MEFIGEHLHKKIQRTRLADPPERLRKRKAHLKLPSFCFCPPEATLQRSVATATGPLADTVTSNI